ncbi:MAG: hypothetical protein K0S63_1134, partial [Gammaproteobacteria bacterium]|nr:hypothetical protein [Gammaproteobacteria bacterium]
RLQELNEQKNVEDQRVMVNIVKLSTEPNN